MDAEQFAGDPGAERRILVVDDAPAILETFRHVLERLGVRAHEVLMAETVGEGLAQFRQARPRIVFMDVNVGTDRGDEAALEILRSAPSTKLILMTGSDPAAERIRAVVSAGAYAILEKPLRFAKIKEVLDLIESESKGLRRI